MTWGDDRVNAVELAGVAMASRILERGGLGAIQDARAAIQALGQGVKIPGVNEESIQPVGVRHTKDGKYTFVALGPANRIAVIDQKSKEVIKYLLVGQRVWQLAFSNDQKTF